MNRPLPAWTRKPGLAMWSLATLLAATALAYWPGLRGGFIFDDLPNLVLSQAWKIGSFTPTNIQRVLQSDISGELGRPLAMLSFAANHIWTGPDPFALKLTNLFMHLTNGVLVYFLCRQLLPLTLHGDRVAGRVELTSALVAGAWLLHPLQVSTVLYSVQRMEIGAATGVLGCVVMYLVARRHHLEGRPCLGWFGLAGLFLLTGLGFKESAVVALPVLLLVEFFVLGFRNPNGRTSRALLIFHSAWLGAALLVFSIFVLPGALQPVEYAHRDFGVMQRLLSQGPVLTMYLSQILFPLPETMLFYYDQIEAPAGLFSPPRTALSFLVLMAVMSLALVLRRRWPLANLGVFWFFACHSLTSNVIPLELAFEHRNYLALLGPILAGSEILYRLTRRLHGDAAFTIGAAPVLALFGLCLIQASTWGDPFRLTAALAGRNPASPRANYDLGTRLYQIARGDTSSPQWSLARRQFELAANLPGASALADQALVVMDSEGGSAFPESRWRALEAKLLSSRLDADNLSALHGVVACRLASRCNIPDAAAIALLQRMQERHPEVSTLAIIRANFTWNAIGDEEAAIAILREWRRRGESPHEVDLALVEFLLASKLHHEKSEATSILANLGGRDLPPEARDKVRELQARLEAVPREPEPQ